MREWGRYEGISWRDVLVNGGPGQVFMDASGRVLGVMALTVVDGVVTSVDAVVNPSKLGHLGEVGDLGALEQAPRE
jgi:RNA polymerase sigma-70 factor (ECF subfamily)